MPLVSVIVPVYNTENYLKRCIESVLSQTCGDFELILVDDGSKDSSPAICDEYAKIDSRIKVLHKQNEGPGIARNVGLDATNGEYFLFVDSDDWIMPEMLEKMVSQAANIKADIVVCGYSVFNGLKIKYPNTYPGLKIYDRHALMKDYVSTPYITPAPVYKLFSRYLFKNIRLPRMKVGEDQYIMHEILDLCNTGVHVGECFYVVNLRQGSITRSRFNANMLGILESSVRLQQFIAVKYPDLYEEVRFRYANDIIYIMTEIIKTFSYHQYKNVYGNLKKQLNEERCRLNNEKGTVDPEKMRPVSQACDWGKLFYIKNLYIGIKAKSKKMILKILVLNASNH